MTAENPYLRKREIENWDKIDSIDPYSTATDPSLQPDSESVDTTKPLNQQHPTPLYKNPRHLGDIF